MKAPFTRAPSFRLRVLAGLALFLVCLAAAGMLVSSEVRNSISRPEVQQDRAPHLGITYVSLSHDIAVRYGVGAESGLLITGVSTGSPAAAAGLERGDIVLAVDGTPLAGGNTLVGLLAGKKPGDRVVLQLQRSGRAFSADLVLGTRG